MIGRLVREKKNAVAINQEQSKRFDKENVGRNPDLQLKCIRNQINDSLVEKL